MSVTLILDSTILSYNGGVWTQTPPGLWYNGSALFSSKATSASTDFLHASFVGTSISWVGVTPSVENSTSFLVNIDAAADNFTAIYPQSEVGCTWWTSPPLSDVASGHGMFLYNLDQIILDYILVTAGTQTDFSGKTIFVDDSSAEITWLGQWTTATNYTITTGIYYNVSPAGNGTHTSTTVGDSFSFTFAGTAISVYGIMSFGSSGTINALFSIDSESATPRSFTANGVANNGLTNASNYQLFSNINLTAGEHTLRVNVTNVTGNLPFIIDYLTYVPTFFNLGSKPDFTGQPAIGSSNVPSDSFSSLSSAPEPSASSSGPSSRTDTSSSGLSKIPAGAMSGGIIGGLVVIAMIIGTILYFHRRQPKCNSKHLETTPYYTSYDQSNEDAVVAHRGSRNRNHGLVCPMRSINSQATETELQRHAQSSVQSSYAARKALFTPQHTIHEQTGMVDMLTREVEPPPAYREDGPESSDVFQW